MKGAAATAPWKRRWRGPTVVVPALVFFSILVPLAFLFGFHSRFPYGYVTDDQSQSEYGLGNFDRGNGVLDFSEGRQSRVNNIIKKFSKDVAEKSSKKAEMGFETKVGNDFINGGLQLSSHSKAKISRFYDIRDDRTHFESNAVSTPRVDVLKSLNAPNARNAGEDRSKNVGRTLTGDESEKSCQLEFGSYCLWSLQNKKVMKDSIVKRLKDQLFVARSYFPTIAKLEAKEKLSRELKQNIQDHERMLSDAIMDADLPAFVGKKIERMDQTIAIVKSCTVDCNNVDKKLRQILDLTEDEAHFHMKQSAFMYHLGVQTMPKTHHCLSMRLTVEYFKSLPVDIEYAHAGKLDNPDLRHYVIFSRNVLAVSVTINSTVVNSKETGNMVFHVLTDVQNYYAMKSLFARNSYKVAAIYVLDFDDFFRSHFYDFGLAQLSSSEEFRIFIRDNQSAQSQSRTEYLSVFGHSHFFLPEIFKSLKKVVVLDDDVVVQRDLTSLWNLDLQGKVNGALEFCSVRLGQLKSYYGGNIYNDSACAWMSGLNIIDLDKWREHDVTGIYKQFLQKLQRQNEGRWRLSALPSSLLTFQDLIFPLDDSWALPGLGHDYGISADSIKTAATLHFNGNMKPWLELGIPKYKEYWKKYFIEGERFMQECNVIP